MSEGRVDAPDDDRQGSKRGDQDGRCKRIRRKICHCVMQEILFYQLSCSSFLSLIRILTFPNDHYDSKQSDTQPEISSKLSASLLLPPPPGFLKAAGLTGLTCYHPRPPDRVLQVSQIVRCRNPVDMSVIIASKPTFIGTAELIQQTRFDLILMTRSPGLTSILLTLKPSLGRIVQSLDRTQRTKCDDYDPVSFDAPDFISTDEVR